MKYNISNIKFEVSEQASFQIENIQVEFDLAELKQFAENTKLIIDTIKESVKELVPVVSSVMEKDRAIRHSYRMEEMEKEMELEKARS